MIAYGAPESTSSAFSQQIDHDKLLIENILEHLGNYNSYSMKFIQLGKIHSDVMPPLKTMFDNKEAAIHIFTKYGVAKRLGTSVQGDF